MALFRIFVSINRRVSAWFDQFALPSWYSVDGNRDFIERFAPAFLHPRQTIVDVGGGKCPFLSVQDKRKLGAHITGLDIDEGELSRAPEGAYDAQIAGDICSYRGAGDADLVICQALLEHVRDNDSAFRSLSRLLKPGGILLIFVPSRNAAFARLNLALPESLKRKILFGIFPGARHAQGFPSYYDRCTPKDFANLAARNGLVIEQARYYFVSSYFSWLFPLYVVWRIWIVLFRLLRGNQAAETFAMAMRKQ